MRIKIHLLLLCFVVFILPLTALAFQGSEPGDSVLTDSTYFRRFSEDQVLYDSLPETKYPPFQNHHRYQIERGGFPYFLASNPGHAVYSPLVHKTLSQDLSRGVYGGFLPYLTHRESIDYYRNAPPFTSIFYMSGAKKEEMLDVIHTRNFGHNLNVSLRLIKQGSIGFFNHMRTRRSHFDIDFNYSTTNHRYAILGNYYFNKHEVDENGGYVNFEEIQNPETFGSSELSAASNQLREEGFLISQSLGIGNTGLTEAKHINPLFRIGYDIHYLGGYRYYRDEGDVSLLNTDFYQNIYFDSSLTADSIVHASLRNQVNLSFHPGGEKLNLYGRHELTGYDQKKYVDTLYNNVFLGALADVALDKYRLIAGFEYALSGFREGDLEADLKLIDHLSDTLNRWSFTGHLGYRLTQPMINQLHYVSNNFIWHNSFKKEKRLFAEAQIEKYGYALKGQFGSVVDLLYYDENAVSSQADKAVSYFTLGFSKHLKWGRFHLDNLISYQSISNQEYMPLPQLLIRESIYLEGNIFNKVLKYQVGADVFYYSSHYGYSYMPALNQFHVQNEIETGSYPYIDLFVNLRLKRAFFFLKMEHFNKGMTGNNYFQVPNYPFPPRSFKFGLKWALFD